MYLYLELCGLLQELDPMLHATFDHDDTVLLCTIKASEHSRARFPLHCPTLPLQHDYCNMPSSNSLICASFIMSCWGA
eukprot:2746270-Amphidinium_carterae.1